MAYVRYQNTLDSGTQGATLTAANSGSSGAAFTQIFGTGPMTYDSAAAITGTRGVFADTNNTTSAMTIYFSQAVAAGGFGLEFSAPEFSGSDSHFARLIGASDSRVVSLHITGANKVRLSDGTGTSNGIWTSTDALTAGVNYRVELWAKAGSTATTGEIKLALYTVGNATPIQTFSTTTASIPVGTPFSGFVWGRITQGTVKYKFDSIVWETDGTGLPGPISNPLATPVVTLGAKADPSLGSNGTQTVTWPSITGAVSYEAWIAHTSSPAQGDFTLVATGVTSPYQFTGLAAGTHAYGIKARA